MLLGVLPWMLPDEEALRAEVEALLRELERVDPKEQDFPEEMRVVLRTVEFEDAPERAA